MKYGMLITGIVLILIGIFAIAAPFVTTLTSVLFLGYLLILGGVVQVVFASSTWNRGGFFTHFLLGIFGILIGLLIISHPSNVAVTLTLVIAILFLTWGIFRILSAIFLRFESWGWFLLVGMVDVILGLLILAHWPTSGLWVIGLFVGLDFLFIGWAFLTTSYLFNRHKSMFGHN